MFAVQRLGKDSRRAGLAHPATPGEEKGMGNPSGLNRVVEGLTDVLLTDQIPECLWSPFSS
jgi:hypothetical protein